MKKNYLFFIIFIFLGSTFLRPAGVVVSEEDALAKDLLGSVFSFYDILYSGGAVQGFLCSHHERLLSLKELLVVQEGCFSSDQNDFLDNLLSNALEVTVLAIRDDNKIRGIDGDSDVHLAAYKKRMESTQMGRIMQRYTAALRQGLFSCRAKAEQVPIPGFVDCCGMCMEETERTLSFKEVFSLADYPCSNREFAFITCGLDVLKQYCST